MIRLARICVLLVLSVAVSQRAWRDLGEAADLQLSLASRALQQRQVAALKLQLQAQLRALSDPSRRQGALDVDPSKLVGPTRQLIEEPHSEAWERVWDALIVGAARASSGADQAELLVVDGVGFVVLPSDGPTVPVVRARGVLGDVSGNWGDAFAAVHLAPVAGAFPMNTDGMLANGPVLWVEPAAGGHAMRDWLDSHNAASRNVWHLIFWIGVACLLTESGLGIRDQIARTARQQERGELFQRLSHNLRTPAASVASLSETLQSLPNLAVDDRDEIHAALTEESRRLVVGTERLLRAARGDAEWPAVTIPVDLCEWLDGLPERWGHRLDPLHIVRPDHPVVLPVDLDQLEEAVDALLDNACKYGAAPVTVSLVEREAFVEVVVRDSGAPIPSEDRQRVFAKLERGDRGQGFGLGLWAAGKVAQAHGGSLRLDGSKRFILRIPRTAS